MLERIKKIMEEENLSSSGFADKINVTKGTITHILSGRNNPSLDVISKILTSYPELNPDWLLFGKGVMFRKDAFMVQIPKERVYEPDLFENTNVNAGSRTNVSEYAHRNRVERVENTFQIPKIQEIKPEKETTKKIDKIMIFYNDKTFMSFSPEE